MLIWTNRTIVSDDWQVLGDDEAVSPGHAIVSLQRWLTEAATDMSVRQAGVLIKADDDIDTPVFIAAQFPLIAFFFDAETDGRGYSVARLLRRRGYTGDLRAMGTFGRDQLAFLLRCGFTSFALAREADADGFNASLDVISLVYQGAADARPRIAELRR
jgi:uncharacterized protein (DUF934 family)